MISFTVIEQKKTAGNCAGLKYMPCLRSVVRAQRGCPEQNGMFTRQHRFRSTFRRASWNYRRSGQEGARFGCIVTSKRFQFSAERCTLEDVKKRLDCREPH